MAQFQIIFFDEMYWLEPPNNTLMLRLFAEVVGDERPLAGDKKKMEMSKRFGEKVTPLQASRVKPEYQAAGLGLAPDTLL